MLKRLALAVFLGIIAVMIVVPLLVITDAIVLKEGENPLGALVMLFTLLFMITWIGIVVWAIIRPWLSKRPPRQRPRPGK